MSRLNYAFRFDVMTNSGVTSVIAGSVSYTPICVDPIADILQHLNAAYIEAL